MSTIKRNILFVHLRDFLSCKNRRVSKRLVCSVKQQEARKTVPFSENGRKHCTLSINLKCFEKNSLRQFKKYWYTSMERISAIFSFATIFCTPPPRPPFFNGGQLSQERIRTPGSKFFPITDQFFNVIFVQDSKQEAKEVVPLCENGGKTERYARTT